MHIGEAIMPRDEAIELARAAVRDSLARLDSYYAKKPELAPNADALLLERIRADETWIFVPFARIDSNKDPFVVRVNGVTRQVSIAGALPG